MTLVCFFNCRILRNEAIERGELWVENGRIVEVRSPEDWSGKQVTRKDCQNGILSPGFIDLQFNGGFGVDFTTTNDVQQCLAHCNSALPATGVTGYCPTIITSRPEDYAKRIPHVKVARGGKGVGAAVLGSHLEGPFIAMKKRGCHPRELVTPIFKDLPSDASQKSSPKSKSPKSKSIPKSKSKTERDSSASLTPFEQVLRVYGCRSTDSAEVSAYFENVSIITLAPEHPGSLDACRELADMGVVVSLGHSESSYARGLEAMRNGASKLTHLFQAMNAFGHREPALPGLITSDEECATHLLKLPRILNSLNTTHPAPATHPGAVTHSDLASPAGGSGRGGGRGIAKELAADVVSIVSKVRKMKNSAKEAFASGFQRGGAVHRRGTLFYGLITDCVHTHPYSLKVAHRLHPAGLCIVTDAMSALGLPDGEYQLGEVSVEVGGVPRKALKKGTETLAGAVTPMNVCVRLFAQAAQTALATALLAASLHPAQALGIDNMKGRLEPGFDADFVIIDDDVNVKETWIDGQCVYTHNASRTVVSPSDHQISGHPQIYPQGGPQPPPNSSMNGAMGRPPKNPPQDVPKDLLQPNCKVHGFPLNSPFPTPTKSRVNR